MVAEDAQKGAQTHPRCLVVSLPLPPRECHQNRSGRHGGLRDEMTAKRQARVFAYTTIVAAYGVREMWPMFGPCSMDVLFRFPDRRRRDLTNYLAACKNYFDGMADALVFRDDSLIQDVRVRRVIDREHPGVVFAITAWEAEGGE